MNIILVGGGKKVYHLTKAFVSKGYKITIINDDQDYCRELSRKHNADIIYGDGSKPYILEDAGVAKANMVIALTPKDDDNLLICQLSSKIYKVAKTIAVINDPRNIEIFEKLGVDTVISTAQIISSLIEQKALIDDITNLIPIEEGKAAIMEIQMKEEYPAVGKRLSEIEIPEDSIIGSIIRNGNVVIPRGSTSIMTDDKLVIIALPNVQSEVLKILRGRLD